MDWVTTSTLLRRLHDERHPAVWVQFVQRFQPVIASIALRVGLSHQDAEDVVQDTLYAFLVGFRKGNYNRSRGRLRQWLYGIARHRITASLNKRSGPQTSSKEHLDEVTRPDELQGLWNREWERVLLELCETQVRTLVSPRIWTAYEQTARQEIDPAVVAETLGMTRNAVYLAKHKVLKLMRQLLADCESTEDP